VSWLPKVINDLQEKGYTVYVDAAESAYEGNMIVIKQLESEVNGPIARTIINVYFIFKPEDVDWYVNAVNDFTASVASFTLGTPIKIEEKEHLDTKMRVIWNEIKYAIFTNI